MCKRVCLCMHWLYVYVEISSYIFQIVLIILRFRGWSTHLHTNTDAGQFTEATRLLVINTLTNYWHFADTGQQACQYLSATIMARQRSLSEIWAPMGTWGTPLFTGSTGGEPRQVRSKQIPTLSLSSPTPLSASLCLCLIILFFLFKTRCSFYERVYRHTLIFS